MGPHGGEAGVAGRVAGFPRRSGTHAPHAARPAGDADTLAPGGLAGIFPGPPEPAPRQHGGAWR
eukprot:2152257-Pleurochrysis_carterae.AAC.1